MIAPPHIDLKRGSKTDEVIRPIHEADLRSDESDSSSVDGMFDTFFSLI